MSTRIALPFLVLVTIAPAQTVVKGGGAALQLAINAASPGDILDVMPGNYSAVTATRGLRISLRSGAAVVVPSQSTFSAITVTSLPAGEALVVEGGAVDGISASACAGAIVCNRFANGSPSSLGTTSRLTACTGPIVFQDVDGRVPPTFGSVSIVDCAQVSFLSCRMPWVSVTNSHATFADIDITPYGGIEGMRIVSGSVSIADSRISGGVAASFPFVNAAILLQGGDMVVTGTTWLSASPPSPAGIKPAIETSGGTLRIGPSVVLIGTPLISGPAPVTFAPTPSLAVARTPGSANYQLTVTAEPGTLAFTLLGLPDPVLTLPWGDAWLSPMSAVVNLAQMPASGSSVYSSSLNGVPPFLTIVAQSAALTPAGSVVIGVPVRFLWD